MEQQINFVTHLGARCFIYFEGNIVILVHFIFIAIVSQELLLISCLNWYMTSTIGITCSNEKNPTY